MFKRSILAMAAMSLSAIPAQADESAILLGKSNYTTLCATCHGEDAKGEGPTASLYKMKLPDLTALSENSGGQFPFSDVYENIILGMDSPAHGTAMMPIWGDFFMADALKDRGVIPSDALYMAAGRAMSLAYYLETLQE